MSPGRVYPSEDQRIGFLHFTRTNRFCRNAQNEPDRDIGPSDREEEYTGDEGGLVDVVRKDRSSDETLKDS